MNVRSFFFLFLGTIMFGSALGKMDLYLTKVECHNYAPETIKNVSCSLTAPKGGLLNVEFAFSQDVKYIDGTYVLTFSQGSYVANFTTMKLNYCKLLSSNDSQFFLKMAMTEIRRTGNFPLECPLKMNKRYYIRGFKLDIKYLPNYIPELTFVSDILVNFKDRKAFRLVTHGAVSRIR